MAGGEPEAPDREAAAEPGAPDREAAAEPAKERPGGGGGAKSQGPSAAALGSAAAGGGIALLILLGFLFKDNIAAGLDMASALLEDLGPAGYALYMAMYVVLEILAIPAIPLTMSAGVLFGPLSGTAMVSVSATLAATAAFLIARYVARDRVIEWASQNPKFKAIDKALGENSFKVVLLLRLSPLLPFALSNYLYGLTSVRLKPYVLGSWLGMLPGTAAYVAAGSVGRAVVDTQSAGGSLLSSPKLLSLSAGLGVTVLATSFISQLVKSALAELEGLDEAASE